MYHVYILSNWDDSVLYIGVTSNLLRRLHEHRNGLADGFTKKYNVHKLVYYESTTDVYSALSREKQLKKWNRSKKNTLISRINPGWVDLSESWNRLSVRRSLDALRLLGMTYVLGVSILWKKS